MVGSSNSNLALRFLYLKIALLMCVLFVFTGGIGLGLDTDVAQIYDFVSNNYEPGDELFFFGFSRGAFTVRSVASIVCDVGILSAEHMSRFPDMWKAYRANTSGVPFSKSSWYLDNKDELGLNKTRVKVVGVWDTVGALVSHAELNWHCSRLTDLTWLGSPRMALGRLVNNGWHPNQQAIRIP